ncbi:hypothetical protein [Nocardia sp. CC227C]|uniref:hypothetical protein n=1 Tax=Nocardia sp. CC227C TaxID=3044562 RepID=UPI00278C854C|nr:hypothetical protein [Nocardia sp. CC227C]
MTRNLLHTAGITAVLLLAVACTTSPSDSHESPDSPSYLPPEEVRNATVVWSAEPGTDLFDTYPTLTRAAAEALVVAGLAGPERSYPGFDEAVTDPTTRGIYFRKANRDTVYGTLYKHIVDIVPTDTGFTAHTCESFKDFAVERDGKYNVSRSHRGHSQTITFARTKWEDNGLPLEMTTSAPTATSTTTPSPAPGPREWQAPEDNLFTGWIIDPGSPDDYDSERCVPWVATLDPDAPAEPETITTDTPPETLPAYPGWPRYRH